MEYYRQQEEARLLRIKEEEEARKREEDERRKQEEAERRAKYDEIAARQRQIEADAEERAKKEREAILFGKSDEGKPGRFVPSSLRNRREDPDSRPRDSLPPSEDRRTPLFLSSRALGSRDDGDKLQRPAEPEREHPAAPAEAAGPAKYQLPQRTTSRYEPPVRRTEAPYGGDAPPPARALGGRFADRYADRDREPERPKYGDRSERGGDDRWTRGAAPRPNIIRPGYGSERSERPSTFGAPKDEGVDSWRRPSDAGRPKPQQQEEPAA